MATLLISTTPGWKHNVERIPCANHAEATKTVQMLRKLNKSLRCKIINSEENPTAGATYSTRIQYQVPRVLNNYRNKSKLTAR